MRKRGHMLLFAMLVLAAFLAASATFVARLEGSLFRRRDDAARLQALWLARSAASARQLGARTLKTPAGPARVTVVNEGGGLTASASLRGGEATVRTDAAGFVSERFVVGE